MTDVGRLNGRRRKWMHEVRSAGRAKARGQLTSIRHGISGDHGGTRPLHQHRKQQTDWPLTQYYYDIFRLRVQLNDTLEAGIHWLDKAGAVERNAIRNFFDAAVNDPIHYPDIL